MIYIGNQPTEKENFDHIPLLLLKDSVGNKGEFSDLSKT